MNIIVIKDKLKEGVDIVSRVAGDHPTLSILKNILVEAGKDKIRLIATNLEVGVQYLVAGKVVEEGSLTVPANLMAQVLGNLDQDRLNIKTKDAVLEITTDNYEAKVEGVSAEEFPLMPKLGSEEHYLEIEGDVLRGAMERVLLATSFSELRPELNAVIMKHTTDTLVFAATDSFRLGEATLYDREFTSTSPDEFQILLPLKTAQEVLRIFRGGPSGQGGKVRIYRDGNQVLFRNEQVEFISRLSEGNFPDYQAIIPREFQADITLDREEFANALKLASVFGGGGTELVLRSAGKKGVEVFSRSEKLGENTYVLPARISGELTEANFNSRYLLDGLRAVGGKEIVFSIGEDNRPAFIKSQGDSAYFYIVMPILRA